jgi:hypothetical protein
MIPLNLLMIILHIPHNIYITSDEEIGTDEYYFHLKNNEYYNSGRIEEVDKDMKFWRKIILTTDIDLIKNDVQAIDDEFLQWFVKNPSCEFVPIITTIVSNECNYKTNIGFESWRKEEPKQETLSYTEAAKKDERIFNSTMMKQETIDEVALNIIPDKSTSGWIDSFGATERIGFIKGAKYQAERMYSEEDMFEFSQWISHEDWVYLPSKGYWVNEEQEELEQKLSSKEILNLWFEQFKKK